MRAALDRAREGGWAAVFVLGDPAYYGRFGFSADAARGYASPYAGEHFLARRSAPSHCPVSARWYIPRPSPPWANGRPQTTGASCRYPSEATISRYAASGNAFIVLVRTEPSRLSTSVNRAATASSGVS